MPNTAKKPAKPRPKVTRKPFKWPQPKTPGSGKPEHKPTDVSRATVARLIGFGFKKGDVAEFLGIDPKTMRKYYRREMRIGKIDTDAKVAFALFKQATGQGPGAVTAAIHWTKVRMGWTEQRQVTHLGPGGGPVQVRTTAAIDSLTDDELEQRIRQLMSGGAGDS